MLVHAYSKLVEEPHLSHIDWSKWHVFWADERVVKLDHPDSNYKLAQDGLLSKVGRLGLAWLGLACCACSKLRRVTRSEPPRFVATYMCAAGAAAVQARTSLLAVL